MDIPLTKKQVNRKAWYAANMEKSKLNAKSWSIANPERKRATNTAWHRRNRYGITQPEFDSMWSSQGGLCALCRVAWATHVDHDHETGRIRGLLCVRCNSGLGMFNDSLEQLRAAVGYVGVP